MKVEWNYADLYLCKTNMSIKLMNVLEKIQLKNQANLWYYFPKMTVFVGTETFFIFG